jgi:hypothetical protein
MTTAKVLDQTPAPPAPSATPSNSLQAALLRYSCACSVSLPLQVQISVSLLEKLAGIKKEPTKKQQQHSAHPSQ